MGNSRVELQAFCISPCHGGGECEAGIRAFWWGGHKEMIAFHKQFAQELINNDYLKREAAEPRSSCQHKEMDHVLISLPHGKKFVAQKWWFPSHPIHRHHVLDAMQRQDLIASVLQGLSIVNTASLNIVKTVKIVFEL